MKKLLLVFAVFALIMAGCKEEATGPQEEVYAEVSLAINEADFVTLKNASVDRGEVPACSDLSMDWAEVKIAEYLDPFNVEIFNANGEFVTAPMKVMMDQLDSKELTVTSFLVYNGPIGDVGGSTLIKAAPVAGDYVDFTHPDRRLALNFTVEKFKKLEVLIDVLCYEPLFHKNFGFTWLNLETMTVRSLCFFGDICTGKLDQYLLHDEYSGQADNYDLVAVMEVVVSKADYVAAVDDDEIDDSWTKLFTNEDWSPVPAVGNCMEVFWGDYDDIDGEVYTIELRVKLPVGSHLEYKTIKTWTFTDEEYGTLAFPQSGDDGVVDFVIGNCAYDDPDYVFAPHQNIPTGNLKMDVITSTTGNGFYWTFNITVDGNPTAGGFDFLTNTNIGGWCGDKHHTIGTSTYDVKAYSSLQGNLPVHLDVCKLSKLNYLFNHLDEVYSEFDYLNPPSGNVIQEAIWAITDGTDVPSALSSVVSAAPCDYVPRPGELAAIIFYDGTSNWNQILFTVVDP